VVKRGGSAGSAGRGDEVPLLDLAGEICPYTFIRSKLALEPLALGAELEILIDHRPATENVPRSLRADGQEVVAVEPDGEGRWRILVVKRAEYARPR
jgi:tRNA 2-thiouridine synthesizing protein A